MTQKRSLSSSVHAKSLHHSSIKIEGIIGGGVEETVKIKILQYVGILQSAEIQVVVLVWSVKVWECVRLGEVLSWHLLLVCRHCLVWLRLLIGLLWNLTLIR